MAMQHDLARAAGYQRPSRAARSSARVALDPKKLARAIRARWQADSLEQVIALGRRSLAECSPGATLRCEANASAGAAAARQITTRVAGGRYLAFTVPDEASAASVELLAEAVSTRLDALQQVATLNQSVAQLARAERLQRALYAITGQATTDDADLAPMFEALHLIVGTLMYAENLYIARYDASTNVLRFSYYADSRDAEVPLASAEVPMTGLAHGPTWYVIRSGRPLMGSFESIAKEVDGLFEIRGGWCRAGGGNWKVA